MTTSVRNSLNIVGQAASIKLLAQQRREPFPLSLRNFVGAPPPDSNPRPPGTILQKSILLDFLQSKFDVLFNQRSRPLFQIRLNNKERKFGQSTLTVAMFDPGKDEYDHDNPLFSQELAGPGERLSFDAGIGPLSATYYYYFQDVNSDGIEANVVSGQAAELALTVHFEAGGPIELKIDGHTGHDIDFEGLNIKLTMVFGCHNGLLDIAGFITEIKQAIDLGVITDSDLSPPDPTHIVPKVLKIMVQFRGETIQAYGPSVQALKESVRTTLLKRFINLDVSVNVDYFPDGVVADRIETTINTKIFEALNTPETRDTINKLATRWLVGGDFYVSAVSSDGQSLNIDYIIPPGQLEPFPESPQAPLDQGLLANIDHIVVLMMENRSFDHMLGYLSKHGGRHDVDGLRGGETNSDGKGHQYESLPLSGTRFEEDPDHSYQPVLDQISDKMGGFVTSFIHKYPDTDKPGKIMGYHTAEHVPVYDAMAREFLICDRWFAAHPGPTFCNRFYTLTGRLNRNSDNSKQRDNPSGNDFAPVATKTIFDHLNDHGVSWHYYETSVENSGDKDPYCFLRMFARYTTDFNNYIVDLRDPVKGFLASAQAGTLPSVSFIDPDFIDVPPGNDDAPPGDIASGQHLIGQIVNAVVNSPKWDKTLLLITYDEHGGFYDHVNPLDLSFRDKAKPVSGIDHYGVRVPTFVVSPWVAQGQVSKVVFDHTSIAKTIAKRFMSANPPDMGERVAAANDLSMVLSSTARQDRPSIPVPPEPSPRLALQVNQFSPPAENDDFKEILRTMRARYPIRR